MDKKNFIFYGVVVITLSIMFYQNIRLERRLSEMENMRTEVGMVINLPDSFDYVTNKFKVYNDGVDTNTVVLFLNTVEYFSLNQKGILDMLIGQILLESKATHIYPVGHALAGEVVRGSSGEVGIAQIMPTTALAYLQKMDEDDYALYDLGATNYTFVNNSKLTNEVKLKMVIEWLSKIENNFALWGFIMREGLEHNGILEAFVIYNAGKGGLIRHLSSNGTIHEHKYLVGINKAIRTTLNV